MEKECISCGMPLENDDDIGSEIEECLFCRYCLDSDGNIKSAEEIFEWGVDFFINAISNIDRKFAELIVRKNMNGQLYWQDKNDECLIWDEATEEEFDDILEKLQIEIDKGNI